MARRGWGEGSICKRVVRRRLKDGTIREYVYARAVIPAGPFGRRREKLDRNERVVRAWLRENIARRDRGLPIIGDRVTVGDYAVDWLSDTARTVRPATANFYRANLRHLDPIANVPLAALTVPQVRALMASGTDSGRSPRTVRGIVQTLALVLKRAMADGIVERNVAALVKLPPLETKTPRHFTAEEARRFLDGTQGDALRSLCAVAIGTGLRRGEALGLEWRDVDLARGTVTIRRSKTSAGVRVVPLPSFALEALRGLERRPGPIWPFRPEYVTRHFQDLCRKAGVPVIRFHDLRHTAASLMLDAGVPIEVIRSILGHTKAVQTAHYARPGDDLRRDAVERLGGAIVGNRRVASGT